MKFMSVVVTNGKREQMLRETVITLGFTPTLIACTLDAPDFVDLLGSETRRTNLWELGAMVDAGRECFDRRGADVVLFTADDYQYRPDWKSHVFGLLQTCGSGLGLLTLEMEPEFPWNTTIMNFQHDGIACKQRATIPGACMVMTRDIWFHCIRLLAFMDEHPVNVRGYMDHFLCAKLRADGLFLVAADLAKHVGAYHSVNGNGAFQRYYPNGYPGNEQA